MEVPNRNRRRALYNSFAPAELQLLIAFHAGEGCLRSTQREALCEAFGVSAADLRALAGQLRARLRDGTSQSCTASTVPTAIAQEYPG
jgi:hypothetical protein